MSLSIRQLSDQDAPITIENFLEAIVQHRRHPDVDASMRNLIRQQLIGDPKNDCGYVVAQEDSGAVAGFIRWSRKTRSEAVYISIDDLTVIDPAQNASLAELLIDAAQRSALNGDQCSAVIYCLTLATDHPAVDWALGQGFRLEVRVKRAMAGSGQILIRKYVFS